MSEELLPCPFCGSPARRIKAEDSSWIGCQRCSGSNTNPFKDIAEREWNTRVESAELAQLREKLDAARRSLEYYADAEWLQSFGGTKMAEKALAIIDGKEANETT